jgi:hypothetical protein
MSRNWQREIPIDGRSRLKGTVGLLPLNDGALDIYISMTGYDDVSHSAAKTLRDVDAIALRDALIELYPLGEAKPSYQVRDGVDEWYVERVIPKQAFFLVAKAFRREDADNIAAALNKQEAA